MAHLQVCGKRWFFLQVAHPKARDRRLIQEEGVQESPRSQQRQDANEKDDAHGLPRSEKADGT